MDVLRAALGESAMAYFGASYGTKLGATYADLFPDRVGRLVLDGAVDVSLDSRALSLGQAAGFETALTAYVDNCVEEPATASSATSIDEGLGTITGLLDDVDAEPLATGDDRPLTVGNGFYGLIPPLYSRDYWYLLDQALQAGLDGDGRCCCSSPTSTTPATRTVYTDNSSEAIYAINCLDDPFAITAGRGAGRTSPTSWRRRRRSAGCSPGG